MVTVSLRRPYDWHVHLRDGPMLAAALPFTARQFARAIVMPNLALPVTDVAAARAYRRRILAALPARLGLGSYSPRLDSHGNSVRGIKVCEALSSHYDLHMLNRSDDARNSIIARTTSRSTGWPMPEACESTSDCCRVVQRSRAIRVVDSAPKPVETPYTGFPDSDSFWICCQLRSIRG